MRLFDQEGASPLGWPFLQRELRRIQQDTPTRILISGSADTGLMGIVASALPEAAEAQIVLAERCETTISQNRLFARHLQREVEFHLGDVRELDCAPVDAVIAHTFLVYFDDAGQRDVMRAWARCLKPGGVVLMSNRLAPEHLPPRTRVDDAVVAERLPVIRERAQAVGWGPADLDALSEVAREFWAMPQSRPITERQMRDNLAQAGLEVVSLEYDDGAAIGPMSRRHATSGYRRAEIMARKPV